MQTPQTTDNLKEYTLVLLKKGLKYHILETDIMEQNHAAHVSYLAELKANGVLAFTGNTYDDGDICEMAVYNIADKGAVKAFIDNDPAITAEIFTCQMLSWFSTDLHLPG